MNDTEAKARLAEVLREWRGPETAVSNAFLADRLLPVVREIADQRAAGELDELAGVSRNVSGAVLRGRAAALRREAGR